MKRSNAMISQESFMRHWTSAQPIVAGYISSLTPNTTNAEDLLQNVAVVLFRKFDQFDERQNFTGWALGVARNEVMRAKRTHARSFICENSDLIDAVTDAYTRMAPELDRRADALRQCMERVEGRSRE